MDPKTVNVTSITHHTYDGVVHEPGDRYDADELFLDTLVALNFARKSETLAPKPRAAGPPPKPRE